MSDPVYLTTRQVADILCLERTEYVVKLIEKGMLPCARVRKAKDGRNLYRPTTQEVALYVETYDPALKPRLSVIPAA